MHRGTVWDKEDEEAITADIADYYGLALDFRRGSCSSHQHSLPSESGRRSKQPHVTAAGSVLGTEQASTRPTLSSAATPSRSK